MCVVIGYHSRRAERRRVSPLGRAAHAPRPRSPPSAIVPPTNDLRPQDLKNAGLKATLPRLKIINLFETSKVRHLTAEDVYKKLLGEGLDIGLATVYRVLTQFEQAGLLVRHHFESGKAVFELNEGTHHDHLVCLQCGRVEEFYDAEIEKRQNAGRARARLRDHRARALSVRRLHEAALPVPQGRSRTDEPR